MGVQEKKSHLHITLARFQRYAKPLHYPDKLRPDFNDLLLQQRTQNVVQNGFVQQRKIS